MTAAGEIRLASVRHLKELVRLEQVAFAADRFSEEQIEYLLTRAHASVFVIERDSRVAGAAYVLWRHTAGKARLYNIAIDPSFQGQGLGLSLMTECELEAARRRCTHMLLEVRTDNRGAIRFYEKLGYAVIATLPDYYEDGSPGLKLAKELDAAAPDKVRLRIPYYAQSLGFTCGSASLMMALKYLVPETELNRTLELNLWKEGTLVFMTSGIGGTGPFGLALAARHRNLSARVILSSERTPFVASVRKQSKREVMRLINEDLRKKALSAGVVVSYFKFALEDILSAVYRSCIPIVLVSTYRLTGDRQPHWVVVTGFDRRCLYIHDPDLESYRKREHRARNLPVEHQEFLRMSRYGKDVLRSLVLIGPGDAAC